MKTQKITPFLWFDHQAEEAARRYVSIFRHSRITAVTRYDAHGAAASGQPVGSVMTVAFELDGVPLVALNGGPLFRINEAVSFVVACDDQAEVDTLWTQLGDGGEEGRCGWLKDRFGVSWQIIPTRLHELFADATDERAARIWAALLAMRRIEIAVLEEAAEG